MHTFMGASAILCLPRVKMRCRSLIDYREVHLRRRAVPVELLSRQTDRQAHLVVRVPLPRVRKTTEQHGQPASQPASEIDVHVCLKSTSLLFSCRLSCHVVVMHALHSMQPVCTWRCMACSGCVRACMENGRDAAGWLAGWWVIDRSMCVNVGGSF